MRTPARTAQAARVVPRAVIEARFHHRMRGKNAPRPRHALSARALAHFPLGAAVSPAQRRSETSGAPRPTRHRQRLARLLAAPVRVGPELAEVLDALAVAR